MFRVRTMAILAAALGGGFLGGCAATREGACADSGDHSPSLQAGPVGDFILLPTPRRVTPGSSDLRTEAMSLPAKPIVCANVPRRLVEVLSDVLEPLRRDGEAKPDSRLSTRMVIDPTAMPHEQGYILEIDRRGIRIAGHDEAGAFYALMTLKQLVRQYAGSGALPGVRIEDWPDFPNRGVMLDVARDKVPEMATLYALVDTLAEWKCNQLQLYTEHTFSYRNHPVVWQDASPMTPVQIRALDAYCRERYIELVPNQNSFGHMHRWLRHEAYAGLGEVPGGSDLCPIDPGSIALLTDMYDDLLPNFSSGQFNVGCDETWSLGKGRSKEACEEHGVGRVYLNFLLEIHRILARHGRAMQFWGDIIMLHPELIPELPENVVAMEWGYEAAHPFAEHGKKFAESGIPFYVVPGTSTWNSLAGRTENALANLRNAAENGRANGAVGYLITDWGDGGHWQFLTTSYLGFAYGAAVSWACDENKDIAIRRALDVHAFEDRAGVMGTLAHDLGNAYRICGVLPGNNTIFYLLLAYGTEAPLDPNLTVEGLQETIAFIDRVMDESPKADMARPDASLIVEEFKMTAALMRLACRIGIARIEAGGVTTSKIPAAARSELAAELAPLLPEFRQLWLARNRSGGLKDSVGRFENLLNVFEAPAGTD